MDILLATTLRALMFRRTWNKYRHILTEDAFENSNASAIYDMLKELHSKNKRNVSDHTLRVTIEALTPQKARRKELNSVVDSIMEIDKRDLDDAELAIRSYVARGYGQKALSYWLTHRDDATLDYGVPARLMAKAHSINTESHKPVLSSRLVGLPGDEDMLRVATGLGYSPELDAALGGGIGNGELGIMLAPPKRGKTSYLIAAAAHAVKEGHYVAYFTLEIPERKVYLRYFQSLVHMTYTDMLANRQLIAARRAQVKGEIRVIDASMYHLTPAMVLAKVEELREEGYPVSYIVIDYVELMYPNDGFGRLGSSSRSLGDMVMDVRRNTVSLDVPTYSAWQVNRGGSDKVIFGTSDISECWEVVKHADIILGQNQGPQELANNVMRIKVLEQRESPARPLIYLHSDMTRNLIRTLDVTEGGSGYTEETKRAVARRSRSGVRVHGGGADKG